ncbi:MAG: FRG domain-containing protein, partial [Acidobacteriota bacterium]
MDNEVIATSWEHLHSELFGMFEDPRYVAAGINRHRTPFVFRGLANVDYRLSTSLQRLNQCETVDARLGSIEKKLLFGFRMYSQRDPDPNFSNWYWLSLAQHHGLPTRLMDWTWSPYVALHFATADVTESSFGDAAVWCINMTEVQHFLPPRLQDILHEVIYNGFYAELMDKVASDLDHFDALSNDPFLVFFEPPSLDARIVNQGGLFSVLSSPSGKPDLPLDSWLVERRTPERPLYRKVIIPASLKWEVRDKLDGAGINERMLFPGLDGV